MALDEWLFQRAIQDRQATLRFYTWTEATLSLGYFQTWSDRYAHVASRHCPVVRRASGGGAIVHDHELTYSLAIPVPEVPRRRAGGLYIAVHTCLLRTLSQWGIQGQLFGPGPEVRAPFLCFQRRAVGDVILGEHKIAGSAQRRIGSAVLQHGSVLLRSSAAARQLVGIHESARLTVCPSELAGVWSRQLADALGLDLLECGFSAAELELADRLGSARFGDPKWAFRR